jgi:hypothetical protein
LFEVSLTSLAALLLALIMTVIGLAAAGMRWVNADMPLLILLTLLAGLAVLISGGGILLYFWGKGYMSRG